MILKGGGECSGETGGFEPPVFRLVNMAVNSMVNVVVNTLVNLVVIIW